MCEVLQDEATCAGDGVPAVLFAQGVVEEPRQDVFFLAQAAQALEELFLRLAMHDEVGTGDQQLGGYCYGLGIGHDPFGGIVETEQDID
ncbi:hypothetical protein D3C73_1054580 [compost metagenome]